LTGSLITDPTFYALAIPAALLVGIGKSGVAGGFGILAVPMIALVMPVPQAAAIVLPLLTVGDLFGLAALIRERDRALALGGWANPHASAASQVGHLLEEHATAEFYLTQIVSHYSVQAVEAFLAEAARRRLGMPGMFGVFYYRSANVRTLETLRQFLPVPVDELRREFAEGATPDAICARSIRELTAAGVRHFYVSNLPVSRAAATLDRILDLV